ncbi:hypothetical protein F2Q70_00025530 [Brassica cretica]|uniref:Uncharacterized protein n=1 Tax=Brassica cretica TaxID=69181 RepID=A0A8S9LF24_BRACR|nr:hypothetical protein F2Q70_00025530 [Brassica cretica]
MTMFFSKLGRSSVSRSRIGLLCGLQIMKTTFLKLQSKKNPRVIRNLSLKVPKLADSTAGSCYFPFFLLIWLWRSATGKASLF